MKRLIILLLAIMPVVTLGQELSKEEKKARKELVRAEKKEQRRIRDSIRNAMEDEREKRLEEEYRRSQSTSLLIITPFVSEKDVFDAIVRRMMQEGIVPAFIDKEYFIIRTPRRQAGMGTYDITYSVFMQQGHVCVRGSGSGYGSIGVRSGMFAKDTEMIVPLEYGGIKGSTSKTAWDEMERFLLNIRHSEVIYEAISQ